MYFKNKNKIYFEQKRISDSRMRKHHHKHSHDLMQLSGQQLCQDALVECFRRILPWNDPCVLNSVMVCDSRRLHHPDSDENVLEYEKKKVVVQLRGVKALKKLKGVCRLFRDAVRCVLVQFKREFLVWIANNKCTVEGVHAAMIVFRSCSETHEILCDKMQYVGVSGSWTECGWFVDVERQHEELRSRNVGDLARIYPGEICCVLQDDIAVELMRRLLISLRLHPQSKKCFDFCECLLKQFVFIENLMDVWHGKSKMLLLFESEIRFAMKPNFKLMNPRLWDLNIAGFDIDKGHGKNNECKRRAHKQLDKYVRALCHTWNVLTLMQEKQIPFPANHNCLQKIHRQINWFSVSRHVLLLLQLRQKVVLNWL
jgi:hypothetical protein